MIRLFRMLSENRRLRATYKKVFSIYLSFMLVMLLVLFPLVNTSLNALQERTLENSREALREALERLENELNHSQQLCRYLYDQDEYEKYLRTGQIINSKNVSDMLAISNDYATLFNMLSLIDDIGLYLPNGTFLLSKRIHVPTENVWDVFLSVQGANGIDEWLEIMKHPDSPFYSFDDASIKRYDDLDFDTYLVFQFDIGLIERLKTRCFVLVSEEKLIDSLLLGDVLEHAHLRLYWRDRLLIENLPQRESSQVLSLNLTSQDYQLQLSLDIQKSFFTASLRPFYAFCTLIFAIWLLVGVFLAILFSRRSVKPLRETLEAIDTAASTPGYDYDESDAYAYINRFIRLADERLQENKLAMANQELLLKENLLERILRGQLFHEEVEKLLLRHFPSFVFPCRMTVLDFSGRDLSTPQVLAELQICARDEMHALLGEKVLVHFSAKMAVLIYASPEQPDTNALLVLGEQLEERCDCRVLICVGREIHLPSEISSSFLRMRQLLRIADGSKLLIDENISSEQTDEDLFSYPANFYEALLRNNLSSALEQLQKTQQMLVQNPHVSERDLQQIFYSYRQSLCQAISANGLPADEISLPVYDSNANLADLMDRIRQCACQLCCVQKQMNELQTSQREREILSAIDKGLFDPDFSIDIISETYNISTRSLQNLIRTTRGTSFMDYVNTCRMEQAKTLLQTTVIPIQEIAVRCGYRSNNTFYKAFQRTYGIPPNVMRKDSQKEKDGAPPAQ